MKLTRLSWDEPFPACRELTLPEAPPEGGSAGDGLVLVADEATRDWCLGAGRSGLCTRRFRADLVVDHLEIPEPGTGCRCGDAFFSVIARHKRCHPGCALDPRDCRLTGRVLFLKLVAAGQVCAGDELSRIPD